MSTLAKITEARQLLEDAGYVVFQKAENKKAGVTIETTAGDGPNGMLKKLSERAMARDLGEFLHEEGLLSFRESPHPTRGWLVTRVVEFSFFPAGGGVKP